MFAGGAANGAPISPTHPAAPRRGYSRGARNLSINMRLSSDAGHRRCTVGLFAATESAE